MKRGRELGTEEMERHEDNDMTKKEKINLKALNNDRLQSIPPNTLI